MEEIKQKIKALSRKFTSLSSNLDITKEKARLKELEAKSTDPGLWDAPQTAKKTLQELADLKKEIEERESLKKDIATLEEFSKEEMLSADLAKEAAEAEKRVEKLVLRSFLAGEYDNKNALVAIHAGQGGVEAMDWTSMLYRMYLRYCEKKGWLTKTIDMTAGEEAGIKSVTFVAEGSYAYGYLKNEAGTHRLVRLSPFNADKLRQTSFALVEVLPELEEVDLPDIQIRDEDLEIQFFRSSSQGGQNVQKVSTAVRITHKPTKMVVSAQSERFQEQNRKNAMNILRAKLWALEQQKAKETRQELKGEYRPASWGTQIRSYVLQPYKMVKDLRTAVETANPEAVLNGEIDAFIEAELKLK